MKLLEAQAGNLCASSRWMDGVTLFSCLLLTVDILCMHSKNGVLIYLFECFYLETSLHRLGSTTLRNLIDIYCTLMDLLLAMDSVWLGFRGRWHPNSYLTYLSTQHRQILFPSCLFSFNYKEDNKLCAFYASTTGFRSPERILINVSFLTSSLSGTCCLAVEPSITDLTALINRKKLPTDLYVRPVLLF